MFIYLLNITKENKELPKGNGNSKIYIKGSDPIIHQLFTILISSYIEDSFIEGKIK